MKKKLLSIAMAVAVAIVCAMGIVACSGDKDVEGTYDFYELYYQDDVCYATKGYGTYTLKDGKITYSFEGEGTFEIGTYEVKKGKLYAVIENDELTFTKKDNTWVFKESDGGDGALLIETGKIPQGYTFVDD